MKKLAAICSLTASATMAAIANGQTQTMKAELIEVRRIWDKALHNAFTDLVRFKERWYCVFREGKDHISPDGALRVIRSVDGQQWESAALLTSPSADLRDPKITVTPDNHLMLNGAAALRQPAKFHHQSMVWFSADGVKWTAPVNIGEPDIWLWRVTWHKGTAYGIGYSTVGKKFVRLYASRDGVRYETVVENLFARGYPNETSLIFLGGGRCVCLLRRDGKPASAQLGIANPPYKEWTWRDLGKQIGGPHMIQLPDGRIAAAARLYGKAVRTSLLWLDMEKAELTEFLTLPSGGDTSYPGLTFHDGLLWVSYYSSHEGKTSIYLAKVRLPPVPTLP